MFNTCENAPPVLEMRLGRPEATVLDKIDHLVKKTCVLSRVSAEGPKTPLWTVTGVKSTVEHVVYMVVTNAQGAPTCLRHY